MKKIPILCPFRVFISVNQRFMLCFAQQLIASIEGLIIKTGDTMFLLEYLLHTVH